MQTSILVAAIVGAAAAYISTLPNEFRIMRQARMAATKEKIFAQINDLPAWHAWSPWIQLDPNAKNSFEGPTAGVGAITRWEGNSKVGAGSMTIIESRPNDLIKIRLDFLKPMKATHTTEFALETQGEQTNVTWSMYGKNGFVGKAVGLIFNCEKMIGAQFEKGLAQMKAVVENRPV
jgi:hypothetical protein